jgi:hypothetical protein
MQAHDRAELLTLHLRLLSPADHTAHERGNLDATRPNRSEPSHQSVTHLPISPAGRRASSRRRTRRCSLRPSPPATSSLAAQALVSSSPEPVLRSPTRQGIRSQKKSGESNCCSMKRSPWAHRILGGLSNSRGPHGPNSRGIELTA